MSVLQEYASIFFGLIIGTLAHFGRIISGGELPTLRSVIGFLMQLAFIGAVAAVLTRKMGITDEDMRAVATAIMAISAQEVIQYFKRVGWRPLAQAVVPSADDEGKDR